nr:E6 [Firstpapillomavirinae PV-HMU-1]
MAEREDRSEDWEEPPLYLDDLSAFLDIPLDDIRVTCAFCDTVLPARDKRAFVKKLLCLVWRAGWPHGICWRCLEVTAVKDSWRNYRRSCHALTVEHEAGQPLADMFIRCVGCWAPLTNEEKIDMVDTGRHLHNIGGYWKGFCGTCTRDPPGLARLFGGAHTPPGSRVTLVSESSDSDSSDEIQL